MKTRKGPPPDHLIPIGWLVNVGVSQEELKEWLQNGTLIKTIIHGGDEFVSFPSHKRPVKFKEIKTLVDSARIK